MFLSFFLLYMLVFILLSQYLYHFNSPDIKVFANDYCLSIHQTRVSINASPTVHLEIWYLLKWPIFCSIWSILKVTLIILLINTPPKPTHSTNCLNEIWNINLVPDVFIWHIHYRRIFTVLSHWKNFPVPNGYRAYTNFIHFKHEFYNTKYFQYTEVCFSYQNGVKNKCRDNFAVEFYS